MEEPSELRQIFHNHYNLEVRLVLKQPITRVGLMDNAHLNPMTSRATQMDNPAVLKWVSSRKNELMLSMSFTTNAPPARKNDQKAVKSSNGTKAPTDELIVVLISRRL